MMQHPEQTLAKMLKMGARALAAYAEAKASSAPDAATVPSLAEAATASPRVVEAPLKAGQPALASFGEWQNVLTARIEELAAAVLTGKPECFVEQVRWTRAALQARGIASETFRSRLEALRGVLAEQIPEELAALAIGCLDRALEGMDGDPRDLAPRLSPDTPEGRLAAEYLVAILDGDRHKARRLVIDAAAKGATLADLYLKVLLPAQEELGRMWVLGEINVAEEHFATTTTRAVMAELRAKLSGGPTEGKTFLIAAVPGNQHDLGIQAVADLFELDGWKVIQLGANVPAEDLGQAVDFYQPDLVGLSVTLLTQLPALQKCIAAVRASRHGPAVKILVGGRAAAGCEELVKAWGGDACAASAEQGRAIGKALVQSGQNQ
jgi:methanogenic corrinoid protein MtbC1